MISEPATPVADGQRIGARARRALPEDGAWGEKPRDTALFFVDNTRVTSNMAPSYGNA